MLDEGYLDLYEDQVPWTTVVNFLRRLRKNPISYDNSFLTRNCTLLLDKQVKNVQDISVARYMMGNSMGRKDEIQVILNIGQADYYHKSYNWYYLLIQEYELPNLKRHRQLVESQVKTTKRSHIFVSQQYHWYMIFGA